MVDNEEQKASWAEPRTVIGRAKPKPIVIPGAKDMTPEELTRATNNERQRRYQARKRDKRDEEELIAHRKSKKDRVEEYIPKNVILSKQDIRILDNKGLVELSSGTRNLTMRLLEKRLLQLDENPEQLEKVNLATLATTFGILFDKIQLMNGLATENISIHAKIDVNMSSDKALDELNKMREQYADSNA